MQEGEGNQAAPSVRVMAEPMSSAAAFHAACVSGCATSHATTSAQQQQTTKQIEKKCRWWMPVCEAPARRGSWAQRCGYLGDGRVGGGEHDGANGDDVVDRRADPAALHGKAMRAAPQVSAARTSERDSRTTAQDRPSISHERGPHSAASHLPQAQGANA